MIGGLEIAASYGPKSALVLDKPAPKHGSEAADRLVMTSAEQCSDLDQETARIRASGRVLREPDAAGLDIGAEEICVAVRLT